MPSRRDVLRSAIVAAALGRAGAAQQVVEKPAASTDLLSDKALDGLLSPWREKERLPAAYAAVVHQGKFYGSVSGVLKVGAAPPATVRDRFRIGSVTKPMTSTLIMLLVADGVLRLDGSPRLYLPALTQTAHADYSNITLRHLLTHAAGLPSPGTGRSFPRKQGETAGEYAMRERRTNVVEDYFKSAPAGPIGRYSYSNNGYTILGAIAEAAMKSPYESLMKDRLFGALGMSRSGVGMPGRKGELTDPWYYPLKDGQPGSPVEPCVENDQSPSAAPQGCVYTTLEDSCRFMRAHIEWYRGRESVGLRRMLSREMFAAPFSKDRNLAWQTWQEGRFGIALIHGGQNADYRGAWNTCQMRIIPGANAGVFVATTTKCDAVHSMVNEIQKLVLGDP